MPFALAFGSFSFVAGFFSLAMVAWRGPTAPAPTPKNQLFEAKKKLNLLPWPNTLKLSHYISLYLTTSHFPNIGKPGTVYARGAAFTAFFAASPACESQSQAGGSLKPLLVAKLRCAILSACKCSTTGGEVCKTNLFLGHLGLCLIGLLGLLNLQKHTSNHSAHPSTL